MARKNFRSYILHFTLSMILLIVYIIDILFSSKNNVNIYSLCVFFCPQVVLMVFFKEIRCNEVGNCKANA